jgi:GNAT superfamily N-acetyltransferase
MSDDTRYVIREVDPLKDPKRYVEIVRLHKDIFPDDDMYLPEKGHWWIAYSDRRPVAFAGMVPVKGDATKTQFYLCRAGVIKKHRGHGLQKRLIRARMQKAKQIGATRVVTSTYCNPVSSNNLIGAGFRMFKPNTGWGATGTNYWTKDITNGSA